MKVDPCAVSNHQTYRWQSWHPVVNMYGMFLYVTVFMPVIDWHISSLCVGARDTKSTAHILRHLDREMVGSLDFHILKYYRRICGSCINLTID